LVIYFDSLEPELLCDVKILFLRLNIDVNYICLLCSFRNRSKWRPNEFLQHNPIYQTFWTDETVFSEANFYLNEIKVNEESFAVNNSNDSHENCKIPKTTIKCGMIMMSFPTLDRSTQ